MSDIKNIRDQFVSKLKSELSLDEINLIKTELFGKNGQISSLFKTVGSIPESGRKSFAANLNKIKDELQFLISFICSTLKSFSSFDINWFLIFFISDILVDYFLKK